MKSEKARAAAAIRSLLKENFPATKFSVTSSSGANTTSVDISWTDGVPSDEVKKFTSKFKYGWFDPMFDQYHSDSYNDDIPQVKWVMVNRHMSDEAKEKLEAFIRNDFSADSLARMTDYQFDMWVYDAFKEHNFNESGFNFKIS